MMGATHIFIGIMSAIAVTEPNSLDGCLAAAVGGTVGGLLCDIDLKNKKRMLELVPSGRLAAGIVLCCIVLDWYLDAGMIRCVRRGDPVKLMAGTAGLILLCIWGAYQSHRGGTHSLLAVALFGLCAELVCPVVSKALVIGMLSHLVLDLLNSKPLQLLYPLPGGYCLGLCRADGRLNRWLRIAGLWGTILEIGICIGISL